MTGPVIVGIGASAGGLEALRTFLQAFPKRSDVSLIIAQHGGDPEKPLLPQLLQSVAKVPVVLIEDGQVIETGRVHVVRPNSVTMIEGHRFSVQAAKGRAPRSDRHPIDHLFRSIATSVRERSVGIVLSGEGADGTNGLQAITEAGGVTFAQQPSEAQHGPMPANALANGVVDHVASPDKLATKLVAYLDNVAGVERARSEIDNEAVEKSIREICEILHERTGHDFLHYKLSTLLRRIQRRMQVLHLKLPDDYVEHLRDEGNEAQALFRELLIGVTEFFRDPEAFEALSEEVIGPLVEKYKDGGSLRVWVAGCGSGEEAYSIGMLVLEAFDKLDNPPEFQIFATDIDERALTTARRGVYDADIVERIGAERLARFFTKTGRRYQVTKELREHCLFSLHSLISDPPFSRVDLVSCRNVLIYFGPHLQKKLVPMFHYALRPGGYLFLGASESSGQHSDLFRTVDSKARIAERKSSRIVPTESADIQTGQPAQSGWHQPARTDEAELGAISQRIVLDEFAPSYVIVDEEGQMVFLAPNLDRYLQPPSGHYANNLIRMTRAGLRAALRSLWLKAVKERRRMSRSNVVFEAPDGRRAVRLTVQPMPELGRDHGLYMVVFEDQGEALKDIKGGSVGSEAEQHIEQLEAELARTREELERTVQDLEAANEELKSSNEELLSINEELQSANEELETSKEDVQTANTALASSNNDLRNLLLSMQIATIFLDADGRIRSFTPAATELYNITSQDIGRPFNHFTHRFDDLPRMPGAHELTDGGLLEDEARHEDGRWFLRRLVAYDSGSSRFEGTLVSFVDITAQKAAEAAVRASETKYRSLFNSIDEAFCVFEMIFDDEGKPRDYRFLECNPVFGDQTGLHDAVGRTARELVPNLEDHWFDIYGHVAITGEPRRFTEQSPAMNRWFDVYAFRYGDDGNRQVALVFKDITARKRVEHELGVREARYRTLFEKASVGIAKVDFDGRWIRVNPRLCEMLGYSSEEMQNRSFEDVTHPDDLEDGLEALRRLRLGELKHYSAEKRYVRRDGSAFWASLSTTRHEDDDEGSTAFIVSVIVDIDARKKAERTRELLIDELNHRVRNMLMVVKSIASQTRRHSSSLDGFGTAFDGRIQALATTHTLLSEDKWQGSLLRDVLERQLRHVSGEAGFGLSGPAILLKPKPSLALSLVFHELATNAVKYGALSANGGRIEVSWALVDAGSDGLRLQIDWRETGGPVIEPPSRNGFGAKLIDINISHEFEGQIERDFQPEGLVVSIELPWNSLEEAAA